MTPERIAQLRAEYDPDKTYCNRKAALAVTEALDALAAAEARAEQAERERDESRALLRDRSPLFQDYEDAKARIATLTADAERERQAFADLTTASAARIDALTAEVERLRGWQSGQTHYVGCWREHRSCALATLDFEGARRERAEMALHGMSDRLTRVINVLLENSEGTSTDGQPCWCGVDPVYSAHADWCVSARRVVSEHNAAANV